MKNTIFLFILFVSQLSIGQDTIYLNEDKKEVKQRKKAEYLEVIYSDPENAQLTIVERISLKKGLVSRSWYVNYSKKRKKARTRFVSYYPEGQEHIVAHYKDKEYDGEFLSYWPDGTLKRKDLYELGEHVSGDCWNEKGDDVTYYPYFIAPEFPGGLDAMISYVRSNFNRTGIPPSSRGKRIKIKFRVDQNGYTNDVRIVQSYDPISSSEAIRMIQSMPKWEPAKRDGNIVSYTYTLPIKL